MTISTTLDELDRGLVHALHLDGRASFNRIATALGTSPQTVMRRYQRLRTENRLRVVGLPGLTLAERQQWFLRLTAPSATARDIARALASRPDTSWVRLTSGGTEIVAIVHTTAGDEASQSLLMHDIPRTSAVTGVSAHQILHVYLGGPTAWRGRVSALTPEQIRVLVPDDGVPTTTAIRLGDADRLLFAALFRDGRASYADLAAASGWSPATVAQRLTELRASGALFFDVDLDAGYLGVTTQAILWMAVPPARLESVATGLAEHEELAFVAATTGATNLIANVLCADAEALHRYLTRRLAYDAITTIETAPVLRTFKGAGPVSAMR